MEQDRFRKVPVNANLVAFFLWRATISLLAFDASQVGKPHALLLEKKGSGEKG